MKDKIIKWLKEWFNNNGKDCKAIIGISGGKDSSIVAALCVEALGKDRVIGVLMPDGCQMDIEDSYKLCQHLGIVYVCINISSCKDALIKELHNNFINMTTQAKENLPPRLRMSTLYAVSQSLNGRVLNTCNLSETLLGWETRWGDAVGDVAPLADLTVSEVKQLGYELNLPTEFIEKTPSDGLCGKSDEEKMGIKYSDVDTYIRTGMCKSPIKEKIDERIKNNMFKHKPIPYFKSGLQNKIKEEE